MNLSQLTTADLAAIGNLLQRRESLQAEIAQIDNNLNSYETGKPLKRAVRKNKKSVGRPTKAKKTASRKGASRNRKGSIREGVDSTLKKAGKAGMHITKIAQEMGGNLASLRQWFATSAKKIKTIKKVGPATYRLES